MFYTSPQTKGSKMFKVNVTSTISTTGNKVTAKAKGKQVTLVTTDALTPNDFAEAAAQVLRKLDTVPTPADVLSAVDTETESGVGMVFSIA